MRNTARSEQRRKAISMLSSLAIHLLLFLLLHLAGMGIKKSDIQGDFDLDAIKVMNMVASARDSINAKQKETKKPREKPPRSRKKNPKPKARVKSVKKAAPKTVRAKAEYQPPQPSTHEVTAEKTLERKLDAARLEITKETKAVFTQRRITQEPNQRTFEMAKVVQRDLDKKQLRPRKRNLKLPRVDVRQERTKVEKSAAELESINRKSKVVPQKVKEKPLIKQHEVVGQKIQKPEVERKVTLAKLFVEEPRSSTELKKSLFLEERKKQLDYEHKKKVVQRDLNKKDLRPRKRSLKLPKVEVKQALVKKEKSAAELESINRKSQVVPQKVKEKPLIKQREVVGQKIQKPEVERKVTLAKLFVEEPRSKTELKKEFFVEEEKRQANYEQKKAVKKISATSEVKPEKRTMKSNPLLAKLSSKLTTKATKKVNDANLTEVVRKKVEVPLKPASQSASLPRVTPSPVRTPEKKIDERDKKVVTKANISNPRRDKVVPKVEKKLFTPKEAPAKTSANLALRTTRTPAIKRAAPKKAPAGAAQMNDKSLEIEAELPQSGETSAPLYKLTGTVEGEVRSAFLTVNDVTQVLNVVNGKFEAEIAMAKGNNKIEVLVFSSKGGVGKNSFNLLYSPLPGAPTVKLDLPENGRQGMQEGDEVVVLGTVDDETVREAVLLLNGIPLPAMPVVDGVFKRKIFLPNTRITTFRVMAKNGSGIVGYSAQHTVLSGYDIDLANPRPY